MLKQATTNSLETNEKNRKSCQRNRSYKKKTNKNYRTEKYNNRNKNLKDGLNNRADGTQNQ